jgi:hypothetical protein
VSRALKALAEDVPAFADAAGSLPIDLYFSHSDVAAMLADSAFANVELDRDEVSIQLAELGYDETTSPVDLASATVAFSHRLRYEIRREAERSGSALFNRLALAQLDRVVDSLQAPARSRSAMLPDLPLPRPAFLAGREELLAELDARFNQVTVAPARSRYREQVLHIAPPVLVGRDAELAEFCTLTAIADDLLQSA